MTSVTSPYVLDETWEWALLEVTFVPKLTTLTRGIYVCCDFVDNSYVRDSYIPVLQSLSVLNEDVTDVTFENPIYHGDFFIFFVIALLYQEYSS
jgi:hypothetical protein